MKLIAWFPDNRALEDALAPIAEREGAEFVRVRDESTLVSCGLGSQLTTAGGDHTVVLCEEAGLAALDRARAAGLVCTVVLFMDTPLTDLLARLHVRYGQAHDVAHFVALAEGLPDAHDLTPVLDRLMSQGGASLEKALPKATNDVLRMVQNESDKQSLLDDLQCFVEGLGEHKDDTVFKEYARRMTDLVDELVLNALFNANPRLRGADRSAAFSLMAEEEIAVRWRTDGIVFGVSVRDPFGALERETLLNYLSDAKRTRDFTAGHSAGLGLRIVLDRLHTFIVSVERGVSTEVVCVARFEKKLRDFQAHERSLHFFSHGKRGGRAAG